MIHLHESGSGHWHGALAYLKAAISSMAVVVFEVTAKTGLADVLDVKRALQMKGNRHSTHNTSPYA